MRLPSGVGTTQGRAYLALVAANLLWGSLAPAAKALVGAVGPGEVAFARGVCACVVLVGVSWLLHGTGPLRAALARPREVGLLGLMSMAGSSLLGQSALQTLPASLYAVLLATSPLVLALVAIALGTTGARAVIGAAIGLVGVAVVVGAADPGQLVARGIDPIGLLFAAGNVGTIVATQLWGRRTAGIGEPLGTTGVAAGLALPVLFAFALAQGGFGGIASASLSTLLLLGYVGVFCTAATFGLLFLGLRHVSASRSAAFWYLVPPTGVLLSWLLLGEPLTLDLALGGALVLGGVALAQTARERRREA